MEVQLVNPGSNGAARSAVISCAVSGARGGAVISGARGGAVTSGARGGAVAPFGFSTQSSRRHLEGTKLWDACEFCQGPLSWKVKFYPKPNSTKGLCLCGHAHVVLRSLGLNSRDTASQREDEGGLSADHSIGTDTLQGVGVNQL